MKRLNHHQYTWISMVEDVLAPYGAGMGRDCQLGLYVDTWHPTASDDVRVVILDEDALAAGPGGETFSQQVLGMLLTDGGVFHDEDEGKIAGDEITVEAISEYLAATFPAATPNRQEASA